MPYHEEENPDQPVWQSVLLFCCKGMIEGIMVVLFFWLLVQVLFTKHLEVHLQILLLVGLIIFCLSLILGCVLCWWKSCTCLVKAKQPVTSAAPECVTVAQNLPPSAAATAKRQQHEEADGDLPEYPSTFTSPRPSEVELSTQPLSASNHKEQPRLNFSLRRLSNPPLTSPLYKPIDTSHASPFAFPKLGLFSKTRTALQRRCTIAGDRTSHNEHSRLTDRSAASVSEEPVPLTPLSYGSNASCKQPTSTTARLHFIMAFAPEQQSLTVTFLSLSGTPVPLEQASVLGSLPPLYPCPMPASVERDLSHSLVLRWKVSSVGELQRCRLRLEPCSLRGHVLGELEADCARDWQAERSCYISQELRGTLEKGLLPEDGPARMGRSSPPQALILLQYQSLAHHIKAAICRVSNLHGLAPASLGTDFRVAINLRLDGAVISSREAKGASSGLNSSFLFELPPGNVSPMLLTLEFLIMQDSFSGGKLLGRVLVGAEAADAGRAHWRDTFALQEEQVRWHTVQPEPSSDTCGGNAV